MAVTINGDGTISGVSVGGLPDGVVDSGTLATGIDATKLADGTVTSTELQYINTLSSNAQTQISAAGGAWNYIATATASNSASLEFTSGIDSTYSVYVFMLKNVIPATAAADLWMKWSTDGGSTYFSSGIDTSTYGYDAGGTGRSTNGTNASTFTIADNQENTATGGVSGPLWIYDPSNASGYCTTSWHVAFNTNISSEYMAFTGGGGGYTASQDVDAVQFLESSGNIASGEIRMYGIADS